VKVDALASEEHFASHIRPVYERLPDDCRGAFFSSRKRLVTPSDRPTLVSSFGDLNAARQAGRPVILMEHGAGQTYRGLDGQLLRHTSYAGGRNRYGVVLALVPGPAARRAYEESGTLEGRAPVVEIGVPKLDVWHDGTLQPTLSSPPTVVVSFHWDCKVVPETRSAWRRFLPRVLPLAARNDVRVVMHAHPRLRRDVVPVYAKHELPYEPTFDRVLETASVYVCDNSSTMYEFASTGRPVVVLNDRIYRRDVEHGLRFWEASELGPHVAWTDESLVPAVQRALEDPERDRAARRAAVAVAYAHVDGRATDRAVAAILEHVVAG
jgi:hypothetical protein